MKTTTVLTRLLLKGFALSLALSTAAADVPRFQSLKIESPAASSTWTIHDRDGAGRQVPRYLSSLGLGEVGTGVATSSPFQIASDSIRFTLCGHDQSQGPHDKNYIALVDADTGADLRRAAAPGNDAMQNLSWDVAELRGRTVRIEVHDGNVGTAYAWLGVGQIDAGDALRVNFSDGLPGHWQVSASDEPLLEALSPGVPFRRDKKLHTIIPPSGAVEIPCGFRAARVFLLGCIVSGAKPLDVCGGVEIHYRHGSPDVIPLMVGFTLDGTGKHLSPSAAMHLHTSADVHQHYLAIRPRNEVVDRIRLVTQPGRTPIPRITAVTVETSAISPRLEPLPTTSLSSAEQQWLESHTISGTDLRLGEIIAQLRRDHKLTRDQEITAPRFRRQRIDAAFRSEGVAVADFDGDGELDIAAGNVYYRGPDWTMVPMLGEPQEFNTYGYSDAFLCYDDDIDQDGDSDLVVIGFPGRAAIWLENPQPMGEPWKRHLIVPTARTECPLYEDVNGDGRSELVFTDNQRVLLAEPGDDPTQPWIQKTVSAQLDPPPGHGMGVGDVDGDGRRDVISPIGWWQQPESQDGAGWPFHPAEFYGDVQMHASDFDGDGDQDVLSASSHGYGIGWAEQTDDGWQRHEIAADVSQTHALHVADINRDGLLDFVTGKRVWAHNGHDPGSFELALLFWYEQRRRQGETQWVRHMIDVDSGVGLQFEIADVNRDGLVDIVTANKKGVFYFQQVPPERP